MKMAGILSLPALEPVWVFWWVLLEGGEKKKAACLVVVEQYSERLWFGSVVGGGLLVGFLLRVVGGLSPRAKERIRTVFVAICFHMAS